MPRDVAGRFLPSLETLSKRSGPALEGTLQRFGVRVDEERLATRVGRVLDQLQSAPNPSPALLERTQRGLLRAADDEMRRVAKDFVRERERKELGLRADSLVQWVAVGDDRTCPDCDSRHDEEPTTMAAWEAVGLPGSPNLICNGNCRCMLIPAAWTEAAEGVAQDEEAA